MPYQFSSRTRKAAGLTFLPILLITLSYSVPAQAGFQWVAPTDGQPASGYGSSATASNSYGGSDIISPVIITGGAAAADQSPQTTYVPQPAYAQPAYAPQQPAAYAAPQPVYSETSPAPAPVQQAPPIVAPPVTMSASAVPAILPPANNFAVPVTSAPAHNIVQGFAANVPLALALRQILPVGTNFSIDQDVNINTLVSYKGGKSWQDTVSDMLAPTNLVARQQGDTLFVSRPPVMAAVSPQPQPMPGAPPAPAYNPAPVYNNAAPAPSYAAPVPLSDGGSAHLSASAGGPTPVPHMMSSDSPNFSADASMSVASPDGWSAERGDTLRKVLTSWCRRANVELQWLAEYDYPMEASAHFSGGFEDAVRGLLAGFENARPQPVAELHTNTSAGQSLLVVQIRGNNYSN